MSIEYIVLCGSAWMNEHGYGINYDWDRRKFPTREQAIDHGFTINRSDDFNIGTVTDGKLTAIGWMDREHDTQSEDLADISRQIYLEEPAKAPEPGTDAVHRFLVRHNLRAMPGNFDGEALYGLPETMNGTGYERRGREGTP